MKAHDVRHLRLCKCCGDMGDGRAMVRHSRQGYLHTGCFYLDFGLRGILELPPSDQGKFRISDMPRDEMRKLMDYCAEAVAADLAKAGT